jgi:hypothetical protein
VSALAEIDEAELTDAFEAAGAGQARALITR